MAAHYVDIPNRQKNVNNGIISSWARRYLGYGSFYALVLDGSKARTSRELISTGLSTSDKIFAPQFDAREADAMENTGRCNVLRMTLSEAVNNDNNRGIPRHIMKKITIFNFDYMGSAFGREKAVYDGVKKPAVYPLSDIIDCLSLTEERRIMVSITVADRLGSGVHTDFKYFKGREHDFGLQLYHDFFGPTFQHTKYRIIRGGYYPYRRDSVQRKESDLKLVTPRHTRANGYSTMVKGDTTGKGTLMWFFVFQLKKDKHINDSGAEFALAPKEVKKYLKKRYPGPGKPLWGFNPSWESSWI